MIKTYNQDYGPLKCTVIDGGQNPSIAVVICHGYGAPGDDLVPFANHWCDLLGEAASKFRFVFPAAPNSLAEQGMPEGRAWWPINMQQLMLAVAANSFIDLQQHEPPGIDMARAQLTDTIAEVLKSIQAADADLVLGGFSQGAMLTMDTALRGLPQPPKMLLQMSGMLVCQQTWQKLVNRLQATEVIQSHGRQDAILPFASAEALSQLLLDANVPTQFVPFDGPHTVDSQMLSHVAVALNRMANKR